MSEVWYWVPPALGLHRSSTARSASWPSTSPKGDGSASTTVAMAGSVTMSSSALWPELLSSAVTVPKTR